MSGSNSRQCRSHNIVGLTFTLDKTLKWLCLNSVSPSSSPAGEEPGSGADFCKLHLQLLPGRLPQLFCVLGPDTGLLPCTSGEPGHCGPSVSCCPGGGSPGGSAGASLPGAVYTVRILWQMTARRTALLLAVLF